jgi:hypothetical protein
MDKEKIKKEIEKKMDFWGALLFFNAAFLLAISLSTLINNIFIKIKLILISILAFINLIAFIYFSMYAYDIAEERYDEFIEREEYWQKQTLKEKILDVLTIIWFMSPIFVLLDIFIIPLYTIPGIIIGIIIISFWLFGPFVLGKDEKE